MFKVITGTLQANHNTIQLTDETITNDSIFEVYADTENVIPSSVSVGGHTVTVTFDSKPSSNVGIKVLINNIVGEFAPDLDHIDANNVYYENPFTGTQPIGNAFADLEVNYQGDALPLLNSIDDELHTDTVLGGVLYHTTTGNTWKKLDASNLEYDNDSTIYSAMGDIDNLTTTSKNLVAAINEVKTSGGGISYSTTEFDTGKTWIDGKKIYGKVLTGTTLSSGNNNISVSDLQIDTPTNIFMNVRVTLSGNTRWRPVPFVYWLNNASDSSWYGGVFYNYPEDTINAQLGPSLVNGVNNWFIVVEYTKRS